MPPSSQAFSSPSSSFERHLANLPLPGSSSPVGPDTPDDDDDVRMLQGFMPDSKQEQPQPPAALTAAEPSMATSSSTSRGKPEVIQLLPMDSQRKFLRSVPTEAERERLYQEEANKASKFGGGDEYQRHKRMKLSVLLLRSITARARESGVAGGRDVVLTYRYMAWRLTSYRQLQNREAAVASGISRPHIFKNISIYVGPASFSRCGETVTSKLIRTFPFFRSTVTSSHHFRNSARCSSSLVASITPTWTRRHSSRTSSPAT